MGCKRRDWVNIGSAGAHPMPRVHAGTTRFPGPGRSSLPFQCNQRVTKDLGVIMHLRNGFMPLSRSDLLVVVHFEFRD